MVEKTEMIIFNYKQKKRERKCFTYDTEKKAVTKHLDILMTAIYITDV